MRNVLKKIYYFVYESFVKIKSFFKNRKINKMKNSYSGRCFIVSTGPSLTIDDLEKIKNEFSISMNSIVNILDKTNYRPNIYMIQDPFVFKRIKNNIEEAIDKKYLNDIFLGSIIKFKLKTGKKFKKANVFNLSLMGHNLGKNKNNFSFDFDKIVYDGNTVTYSAIQLAVFLGFTEICLLGNDCNYFGKIKHFDSSLDKGFNYDNAAQRMLNSYKYLSEEVNLDNIKIYNCTRGGSLELFERKKMEDILNENSSNSADEIK